MSSSRSGTLVLTLVTLFLAGCATAKAAQLETPVHPSEENALPLAGAAPRYAPDRAYTDSPAAGDRAAAGLEETAVGAPDGIQVRVTAPVTTVSWDARDPDRARFDLPLLYLHRQRAAAPAAERTLEINVVGLAGGAEIQIEARSHHKKLSIGLPHKVTQRFVAPDRPCTAAAPCRFRWTLDPAATPSDFYRLRVKDAAGETLWQNERPERPDFVALETWDVGAGAYTVRVTYATLFPLSRAAYDPGSRLPHDKVTDFVAERFAPIIQETWHTQVEEWGLGNPLHPEWDADKVVDVIVTASPFALFDSLGTHTVFNDAERRIWWAPDNNTFAAYRSLEDGYRAVFSHEFFHLMQWNVLLGTGRPTNYWPYAFIESQGMFAPSAQYPELALRTDRLVTLHSPYVQEAANGYLERRLNDSLAALETDTAHRYDLALYWRFLYEQYGGMGVVRAALEEMARRGELDIVSSIPVVMDAALARVAGPFRSYEESLVAFARANYGLRLANGRCADHELTACDGLFYDPEGMYADPPLEATLSYSGGRLDYRGAIPSSYGIDFVEIRLDPALRGQPLRITFRGEGAAARFNLQIWALDSGSEARIGFTPGAELVSPDADGAQTYVLSPPGGKSYDRVVLIIVRLDSKETTDPIGGYEITLEPSA